MTAAQHTRPWYCLDALVDDYLTIHRSGGDLRMLKALKIVRTIVVNVGIIAITLYSLHLNGDPTVVAMISLVSLASYNGAEIIDYQALAQAIVEAGNQSESDEGQ